MRTVSATTILFGVMALGCAFIPPPLATSVQLVQETASSVRYSELTVTQSPTATPTLTSTPTPTSILTLTAWPEPTTVSDLLLRVNNLRLSLGLPPLTLNSQLSIAAQNQAEWMASTGIVVHQRPDGSLPSQRAFAAGYPNSHWVSEIIYMGGIATIDDAWNFWLTSKVHYTELTRLEHQEVGIGTSSSKAFGQSFVMLFGRFGAVTAFPITAGPGMYIVQPGDTLYLIALRHGTTVEALAAANHIGPNDIIYVGQVLVVPQTILPTIQQPIQASVSPTMTVTPSANQPTRTPTRHVVQPGETLLMISRQYNVPLDKLIAANSIANPDRIEVGQVITIP